MSPFKQSFTQPAVLIFDTDLEHQAKLARLLSDEYHLFPCSTIEEGVMAIIDQDQAVDLIIVNFDDSNGARIIATARRYRPDVPIIVMSSNVDGVGIVGPQKPTMLSTSYTSAEMHSVVQTALSGKSVCA